MVIRQKIYPRADKTSCQLMHNRFLKWSFCFVQLALENLTFYFENEKNKHTQKKKNLRNITISQRLTCKKVKSFLISVGVLVFRLCCKLNKQC